MMLTIARQIATPSPLQFAPKNVSSRPKRPQKSPSTTYAVPDVRTEAQNAASSSALTRRGALTAALLVSLGSASNVLADEGPDAGLVVFDEAALLEAEAEAKGGLETDAAFDAAAAETASAPPARPSVSKITVQTASSSSIDGQGSLSVLLSDDLELAEEELRVTERQALQINRRTQKQNNVPPDFPLFARDGYDMTILVSNGYKVTDDGLLYKDYVVGSGPMPSDGQQVTFDYTGYNESGGVIDSSYRKGAPSSMRIGVPGSTVVPGFELGVKTMAVGGKRRIVVPPELGPPVGPQTFFSAKVYEIFDVELRSSKTCVRRTVGMFSDVVCSDD